MTKENFWPDAARGGVVIGLIAFVAMYLKVWAGKSMLPSIAELIAVAYSVFVFGRRRGEQTYGRCMKFVLAMMLLAGVIYGAGYYFMVNHWAAAYFDRQFEQVWEAMGLSGDMASLRAATANPFYCVISGMLAEVFYGGLVGLFVVAFIRRR